MVPVMLPSERDSLASSSASLPYKPASIPPLRPAIPKPKPAQFRPRLSLLEATIRIQRAYRRHLRLRKPSKSTIKEIETWTLDEPLQFTAHHEHSSDRGTGSNMLRADPDAEQATRSLYHALDQLRVLRGLASSASSQETSFTLSESAISREVTPGQSRLIQVLTPVQQRELSSRGSLDDFQPGVEGETSIDTDILLRSSESLEFT